MQRTLRYLHIIEAGAPERAWTLEFIGVDPAVAGHGARRRRALSPRQAAITWSRPWPSPGITCVMPAALPVVAFGSDGTAAKPAERSAGQGITLRDGVTVCAGVNPKTTNEDGGKELSSLIVSVSDSDPNPVSLNVGSFVVDKPIVTNWHTSAAAVPFSNRGRLNAASPRAGLRPAEHPCP
ncbi:hypothetical protein ACFTXM_02190 [Streptomyces sp. NPDC056930]|uniref:hypothetical protein n=1 Tax=Streptomyces sp. NPDC056930 TaxID=3345967 RepID=UPI0036251F96